MPTTAEQLSRQLQPTSDAGEPAALVTLYELDLRSKTSAFTGDSGDVYYFHAGINPGSPQALSNEIWFRTALQPVQPGVSYKPFPIRAEGFEWSTKGTLPRPTLSVSNIQSVVSSLCREFGDLVGAVLTQRHTFSNYLDTSPEHGPPYREFPPNIFVVDRKSSENNSTVAFELATAMDAEGVLLPRRQILATACSFTYRGVECGYTGMPIRNRIGQGFGVQKSDGVIVADAQGRLVRLQSATAGFLATDAPPAGSRKIISGPAFYSGTYTTTFVSATEMMFWPPANSGGGSKFFVFNRLANKGAWNKTTSYVINDAVYVMVNGVQVWAVSRVNSNVGHVIFDENYWWMDTCLKKLGDCEDHFLYNQPSPYGGFPGANMLQ